MYMDILSYIGQLEKRLVLYWLYFCRVRCSVYHLDSQIAVKLIDYFSCAQLAFNKGYRVMGVQFYGMLHMTIILLRYAELNGLD